MWLSGLTKGTQRLDRESQLQLLTTLKDMELTVTFYREFTSEDECE